MVLAESSARVLMMPEQLDALARRAANVRNDYAREGWTVYDRLDRWRDEHEDCQPFEHMPSVEQNVYVILCAHRQSVAVCESWQFTSAERR